jgi:hypothetical protein
MDRHFTALWDGGHIKVCSVRTLRALLAEAGLQNIRLEFAGRIRPLAKSMIAIARRPHSAAEITSAPPSPAGAACQTRPAVTANLHKS